MIQAVLFRSITFTLHRTIYGYRRSHYIKILERLGGIISSNLSTYVKNLSMIVRYRLDMDDALITDSTFLDKLFSSFHKFANITSLLCKGFHMPSSYFKGIGMLSHLVDLTLSDIVFEDDTPSPPSFRLRNMTVTGVSSTGTPAWLECYVNPQTICYLSIYSFSGTAVRWLQAVPCDLSKLRYLRIYHDTSQIDGFIEGIAKCTALEELVLSGQREDSWSGVGQAHTFDCEDIRPLPKNVAPRLTSLTAPLSTVVVYTRSRPSIRTVNIISDFDQDDEREYLPVLLGVSPRLKQLEYYSEDVSKFPGREILFHFRDLEVSIINSLLPAVPLPSYRLVSYLSSNSRSCLIIVASLVD